MRRFTRATIALPLVVLLAGALIPALVDRGDGAGRAPAEEPPATYRGRTADQWVDAARQAAARESYRRALKLVKTAERLEPGTQYADVLRSIRRARWRSREVSETRQRFLEGPVAELSFRADGSVEAGHRTVVALPGESLWSLARCWAAAEVGVPEEEMQDEKGLVYARWDRLVGLNGLRELEVGELVRLPLGAEDVAAIESSNTADLERIAEAGRAVESGDIDRAEALLDGVRGDFARDTEAYRDTSFDIAMARELSLAEAARAAIDSVAALPRRTGHSGRLALIERAADAMEKAENMRSGPQYSDALELIERLSFEERRYQVREDGSVVAVKPAGASYTSVARDAVEWLLERELEESGNTFPHSHLKTDDERAWARYLLTARARAEAGGVDFAALLAADSEAVLHLPEPTTIFAD